MPHTLDFYWDFSSPFSYLAAMQAESFAARTGAELRSRPMLLGALFKAIGTADAPLLTWPEQKRRHAMLDMQRWSAHLGVPFNFPTRFPMNTVKALRAYLALPTEKQRAFRDAVFRAYWAEDRDIASDAVLAELLGEGAAEVLAKTQTQAVKDLLFAATKRAIDAGVFGAPTSIVDEAHLFWGQDRLLLVEDAIRPLP